VDLEFETRHPVWTFCMIFLSPSQTGVKHYKHEEYQDLSQYGAHFKLQIPSCNILLILFLLLLSEVAESTPEMDSFIIPQTAEAMKVKYNLNGGMSHNM